MLRPRLISDISFLMSLAIYHEMRYTVKCYTCVKDSSVIRGYSIISRRASSLRRLHNHLCTSLPIANRLVALEGDRRISSLEAHGLFSDPEFG